MLIGLTGAQGTGKTTLAQKYAQRYRAHFLKTELSSVFVQNEIGISEVSESLLMTQLDFQKKMMDYLYSLLIEPVEAKTVVTDRTFVDIAAYTLAILPYGLEEESDEGVKAGLIVRRCLELQRIFFNKTLVVQPGVSLSQTDFDRANRGRLAALARHRINAHTLELAQQMDSIVVIPASVTRLEDRIYLMASCL